MWKSLKSLTVLVCLCSPAFAQTPKTCQDQLQHFTVPEYAKAFSTVAGSDGWAKLPSRLLFSENGIEVYADTFPNGRADFLTQVSESGLEVLVVYQDETVRQATIRELRERPGEGILVDNLRHANIDSLKYAKITFMPKWLPSDLILRNKMGNPFEREWFVGRVEYDQPCPSLIEIAETDPVHVVKLRIDSQPLWVKAFQAMFAWAKECVKLVDR
jgi:hypothetical protein